MENIVFIPIAGGFEAIIDIDLYEEMSKFHWHMGTGGYANKNATDVCKHRSMHRKILDVPRGMFTDHINGNRLDNRRSNLRIVTPQENAINRGKNLTSQSKYKGVTFDKRWNLWMARVTSNNKTYNIGCYKTELEAAEAYNKAAPAYHGEFVRLNAI